MSAFLYYLLICPIELLIEFVFSLFYQMVGSPGASVIAVSMVISFLVLPLYRRSDVIQEEERKQREKLDHWTKKIKRTFRGDERTMMLSAYYLENDYRPWYSLRSSVSLLLQIPFFIAAWHFLSRLELLRGASFLFIRDLGAPDALFSIAGFPVNVLPIAMTVLNLVSGMLYARGTSLSQKLQLYGLALFFLVFLYRSPSGMVLYWTMNNAFSLGKNIFFKCIRDRKRVFAGCCAAAGLLFAALMALRGKLYSTDIRIFTLLVTLLCFIPLLLRLTEKLSDAGLSAAAREDTGAVSPPDHPLFLLTAMSAALFIGGFIPLMVIGASPVDFVTEGQYENPLAIAGRTVLIAAGFLVIWNGVVYFLLPREKKTRWTMVLGILLIAFLIDCFAFPSGTRDLSETLVIYSGASPSVLQQVLNAVLIAATIPLMIFLFRRLGRRRMRYLYVTILGVMIVSCIWRTVTISRVLSLEWGDIRGEAQETPEKGVYHFSRNGKNVLVIMLDKAINRMIPYLMEEDQTLARQFSGFVYYPNTMSFANHTNYGLPAVFGGYDYTTEASGARPEVSLRDKHDEALTLMPRLFSAEGYDVAFCDPTYAGYREIPDLTVFDGIPGVRSYNLRGHYMEDYQEYTEAHRSRQTKGFMGYGLYRVLPACIRVWFYDGGFYRTVFRFEEGGGGTGLLFLSSYSTLEHLRFLSQITEDETGCVNLCTNDSVHDADILKLPEYEPALSVDNSDAVPDLQILESHGGPMPETGGRLATWESYMASMRRLGEWFDYLREEGVYDNTRIILVSDHGHYGWSDAFFTDTTLENGVDAQEYNPLLMVKDFDAVGWSVSEEFMTNADVPTLAMDGLVESPVNPFTGNPVNSDPKKEPQRLTTANIYSIEKNNGNVFDTSNGRWYEVTPGDLYDARNWREVSP